MKLVEQHAGPCKRGRPGCSEAGIYKPFYQGFVCPNCLELDRQDVGAGRNPPGNSGIGTLFRTEERMATMREVKAEEGAAVMSLHMEDVDAVSNCHVWTAAGPCKWHAHGDSLNDAVLAWTNHLAKEHPNDWY